MENNVIISTKGLKKSFDKLNVLKGIDIDIHKGDVVCIIEAMKCMNEIQAEEDGEITAVLATNGELVEYGQPLFAIQ